MSLKNFGGVLDFAIELESSDASFLQEAISNVKSIDNIDLLQRFIQENKKNIKLLTRARQENVTEMILESISGLDAEQYQISKVDPKNLEETGLIDRIKKLEERAERFYQEAAEKIKPVSDAAGTFEKLAKKRRKRKQEIESLK